MLHLPPVGIIASGYNAPAGPAFNGGNITYGSLYDAAQSMAAYTTSSVPTAGGTLTINGVSLGFYDFCVKQGDQTISAFTATDWFTATQDTRSAFVVVNGALTINSGITVIPTVRKLFVVVYCTGNLTLNGSLSMSLRGANHSGTGNSGGATTAGAIRIATGTFSSVANPTIPAAGGSGGAARTANGAGAAGGTASFGSGGGGSGSFLAGATSFTSGAGAAGTCFSGGPGGGALAAGTPTASAGAGTASGGAGGTPSGYADGGGVGNPPTAPSNGTIETGTGGTIIVICGAAITGTGSVTANGGGANIPWFSPAPYSGCAGGGSGGGSVTVMGKSASGPTITANGGIATGGTYSGGQGGAGATNTLIIP